MIEITPEGHILSNKINVPDMVFSHAQHLVRDRLRLNTDPTFYRDRIADMGMDLVDATKEYYPQSWDSSLTRYELTQDEAETIIQAAIRDICGAREEINGDLVPPVPQRTTQEVADTLVDLVKSCGGNLSDSYTRIRLIMELRRVHSCTLSEAKNAVVEAIAEFASVTKSPEVQTPMEFGAPITPEEEEPKCPTCAGELQKGYCEECGRSICDTWEQGE